MIMLWLCAVWCALYDSRRENVKVRTLWNIFRLFFSFFITFHLDSIQLMKTPKPALISKMLLWGPRKDLTAFLFHFSPLKWCTIFCSNAHNYYWNNIHKLTKTIKMSPISRIPNENIHFNFVWRFLIKFKKKGNFLQHFRIENVQKHEHLGYKM